VRIDHLTSRKALEGKLYAKKPPTGLILVSGSKSSDPGGMDFKPDLT